LKAGVWFRRGRLPIVSPVAAIMPPSGRNSTYPNCPDSPSHLSLKLTVTYWGGGKGRWVPRPFLEPELPAEAWDEAWGERTGDLFLNAQAHFAHVPEVVWTYQLGGYPVLKKWLGYRQADRRDSKPLTDDERRWLRQMIQRIAALLALGPTLDDLYQECVSSSFTAAELGIRA